MALAIIGILLALLLAAIQKVRSAAARLQCAHNMRQIGLALHQYHDARRHFPPGTTVDVPGDPYHHLSWRVRILPYLEHEAFWQQVGREYAANPYPFIPPYHASAAVPFPVFCCPMDGRVEEAQQYRKGILVALSSYLGVEGTDYRHSDGILYKNSRTRMTEVRDGLSNTLLVGERPPSNDYRYGWLYFGTGQGLSGSLDHTLGVREIASEITGCAPGPHHFQEKALGVPCAFMHYWSLHDGGGHFLMGDGSVHFFNYSADPLLPALATRASGDIANLP